MKKLSIFVFAVFFVLVSGAWAAPPFWHKQDAFKERLVTMRNWKLMEEFNLSGKEAQHVFNILKKYDEQRERLIIKRRNLYRKLSEEVDQTAPSEKRLKDLIRELTETNVELARIPDQELEGLGSIFSLKDQARYLLFIERFGREMQRVIPMRRPDRRRDFPGR